MAKKVQKLNKEDQEFINNLSHEMKTQDTLRSPEMERLYEIIHKLAENKDETKKNN